MSMSVNVACKDSKNVMIIKKFLPEVGALASKVGWPKSTILSYVVYFKCFEARSSENLEMKAFEKFENAIFFKIFKIPSDRQLILV